MRSLRRLCAGFGLLAIALTGASAAPASSAEDWLNNYYRHPDPEGLAPAVFQLSRAGYFEAPGHTALAIGFLASVFAENPQRVDEWLAFSRVLPVAHQRLVVAALWYSGNARGAEQLRRHAAGSSPEVRAGIEAVLASPPSLPAAAVLSAASLNLQWGAFLATGSSTPVHSILAALGRNDRAQLGQDVRWSLAQNAARHDRVLAICRDELTRQTDGVGDALRAVIREAELNQKPAS